MTIWRKNKNNLSLNKPLLGGGYTIVEVMIVLAVTTALFVAVVATFGGQQGRTQFTQGARDMESRVRDIVNDVSTGYYPSIGSYTCTVVGGEPYFTAGGSGQGTNGECVFVGRVIQFKVAGTNSEEYRVFSVAGTRQINGKDAANFNEAQPRAIAISGAAGDPPQDGTETGTYPGNMKIGKVTYNNGADIEANAVGFFSSFGVQATGGGLKSGSISVNVLPIGDSSSPTQVAMAGTINAISNANLSNPSSGMKVCFTSTSSNQIAILDIGGSGRQLTVNMVIKDGTTTCP